MKTAAVSQTQRIPIWNRVWTSAFAVTALGYAVVVLYGTVAPYLV